MNAEACMFFDDVAEQGLWHSFDPQEMEYVERYLRMWSIAPGDRVLEPGCGRGRLSAILADAVGPGGRVLALDISPGMIASARRRELPAQVEFRKACFLDMDASDGTFDHVICCNVWPHLSDAGRSIAQAWSLLNSPGEFWICHLCGRVRLNHIHRSAGHAVHDHQLPPAAELAEMVAEQGFVVLDCEDSEQLYWIHSRKGSR
jgi:cyclopropane fatty-acyl-phospholipid synthase-like methyltransferase